MEHDAWFFIGVFVFIFLIWIATGGPLHSLSFTGPRLALPDVLGGGTYLQFPRAPYGVGNSIVALRDPLDSRGSSDPQVTTATFVSGTSFGVPSPYRSSIRVSHVVSGAGSADPKNEHIEISVSQNVSSPINFSDWILVSEASGKRAVIPRGVEVLVSGVVNTEQDIILAPGDRALIISGQSPIGGSFRENKCIGYFSTFQTFSPALPQNCPVPSDELKSFYGPGYIRDAACIDYVDTLPRCRIYLSPPVGLSSTCQAFLVKYLHYNGCVEAHRNDRDFEGNTWRIYLGRTEPLWRTKHELVKLLDPSGKTVDAFTY